MKNKIIDKQLFMESMDIKSIDNDIKAEDISYELNVQYYIDGIENNKVSVKLICEAGFKPNLMFKANLMFDNIVEFDKEATTEDVELNIDEIVDSLGSEVSYLVSILTKSIGGVPLVVPPLINKVEKISK